MSWVIEKVYDTEKIVPHAIVFGTYADVTTLAAFCYRSELSQEGKKYQAPVVGTADGSENLKL